MCKHQCTHLRKMVYFSPLLILDKCFSTVCACFHSYKSHQVIGSFQHYCSNKKTNYFWDQMIFKLVVCMAMLICLQKEYSTYIYQYQLHSSHVVPSTVFITFYYLDSYMVESKWLFHKITFKLMCHNTYIYWQAIITK